VNSAFSRLDVSYGPTIYAVVNVNTFQEHPNPGIELIPSRGSALVFAVVSNLVLH